MAAVTDLDAWLDALDEDDQPGIGEHEESATLSPRALREADELELALAEVCPRLRGEVATPFIAPRASRRPLGRPARFDARALAERLLAESQQHAVLEAEPAELLAAQLGSDALSEELLARLLEGVVPTSTGRDTLAAHGPTERGLLALLALQLYVHEARRRTAAPPVPESTPVPTEPAVVTDARLLQVLAVPHAASRPLGERRPRGRPRR
jgi:hypothetical protein